MKQAIEHKDEERARGKDRRRRALFYSRIAAAVLAVLALALEIYTFREIGFTAGGLMLGVAGALLLVEALTLCVDLPVSRALQGVLGVLFLALLAGGFVTHNYARVDGKLVPRYALQTRLRVEDEYPKHFEQMQSLMVLDMRGSTVTDFEPILALESLERLDIRENYAFTQQEHDRLAEALPNCEIRWSVPIADSYFDSGMEYVDLSQLDLSTSQLREMFAQYPDKTYDYRVPLYGGRYASDTVELDLQGQEPDVGVIDDALGLLPEVTTVDLRGVRASSQTVSMLCDAHPDVHFMFTCDVPGGEMTTEDTEVVVEGTYEDLLVYAAFLNYMPNLVSMDARTVQLNENQMRSTSAFAGDGRLKYGVTVQGRTFSTMATDINLDNVTFTSVDEVESILACLPNLKRVSMCDTGLTEDQMGQLFDAHPDIKFVWWIEFGHYKLRTDATAFTTALGSGNRYGYNDETFAPLRYCTDLMMLDLGHNHITSLDNFVGLKKLRVLILADNKLTDISQITAFPDLEYIEVFLNDITDVSPLAELKKLVDLNIFYNPIGESYRALKTMTGLKRLWIGGCRLSNNDVEELESALPNTKINIHGRGSTGAGWRKHSHYYTIKQMYEEGRYVPFDD